MCFSTTELEGFSRYIEVVDASILNLVVDHEKKILRCGLAVLKPEYHEVLLVDKHKPIEILDVKGLRVFPLIDVGRKVFEGSKLCYIVTKKYEVRVFRSPFTGVVFYIGEVFLGGTPSLIIAITGEEGVSRLTRSC